MVTACATAGTPQFLRVFRGTSVSLIGLEASVTTHSSCSFCRSLAGDALSLQQWLKAVQVQGQSLGAAAVLACAQLPGGRAPMHGGAPSQGAASMATTIPESSSCP